MASKHPQCQCSNQVLSSPSCSKTETVVCFSHTLESGYSSTYFEYCGLCSRGLDDVFGAFAALVWRCGSFCSRFGSGISARLTSRNSHSPA